MNIVDSIKKEGKFIEVKAQGLTFRAVDAKDVLELVKDLLDCRVKIEPWKEQNGR